MKIINYSSLNTPEFVVQSVGDNISGILDKLVRITAKYTDRYASDVFIWYESIAKAIKKKQNLCVLLGFYEDGINSFRLSPGEQGLLTYQIDEDRYTLTNTTFYICFWMIQVVHENGVPRVELRRMMVMK